MSEARVMIVEDEVIVAEDLKRHLEAAGFEVAGHAMNGQDAVEIAQSLHPDVILMDVFLGGDTNGIDAARSIQGVIDTAIIFVSAHSNDSLVSDAVRSGAFGYIVKPFQARQITSSIRIALQRRMEARQLEQRAHVAMPFPVRAAATVGHVNARVNSADTAGAGHENFTAMLQRVQALLVAEDVWSSAGNGHGGTATLGSCVTLREREVIRGLVCYRRLAKVADVLGISIHTVRNHLKSVFRKLNLHSQDELLHFLLEGDGP